MLNVGVGLNLQHIGRLIEAHLHLERKGIPFPENYQPLPQIVDSFYEETSHIFSLFLTATEATSDFAIRGVLSAAKRHTKTGFEYVKDALQIARVSQPPGA